VSVPLTKMEARVASQTIADNPLTIDVVSDVVCPWCYIGRSRLSRALAMRPDQAVVVNWRPFQLDSTIPAEGIARLDYLTRKFGGESQIADYHERLTAAARAEELPIAMERIRRSPNTLAAHQLIRWSHGFGRQEAIVGALFQAYFVDGIDIGSVDALVAIAEANGIDARLVREFYETEADLEAVREEIAIAERLGIRGVPFFIFGGTHAVSGAEAPETLASAMDQAVAHAAEGTQQREGTQQPAG